MEQTIALRPVTPQDTGFLYSVYASTRETELAGVPWDEAQKTAFLQMQFAAQHKYYTENYQGAEYQVLLLDGEPVGRLYVARWPDEIRVMDIALLPAYRGRGIGSRLMEDILAEGWARGVRVSIHVECYNPALRLYRRLGFRHVSSHGPYYLMEWVPAPRSET